MSKKLIIGLGHLLFWTLSAYTITRMFCALKIEVFENVDSGGVTERVVRNFDANFTWAIILTVTLSAIIFYTNVLLLLKEYFKTLEARRYLLRITLLTTTCMLADVLLNKYVNYDLSIEQIGLGFPSIGLHMFLFAFYLSISFAYAFTLEWYRNEKLKRELIEDKLQTELNFLKNQINPHFLFNTLNNLYSIAQKHQVWELSTGVQELSKLMRYMLYESNSDFVPLQKEVSYLESFIEIQQLRYEGADEMMINFTKEGDWKRVAIAPMILLPFVENAFKHGFSLNESSVIQIELTAAQEHLTFKVKNKAFNQQNFSDATSGIGLENVTRRLKLIYPERHSLRITEANLFYTVVLTIQTHAKN